MRLRQDPTFGCLVTAADFHRWLTLSRLVAASMGATEVTAQHWSHALSLDTQRKARHAAAAGTAMRDAAPPPPTPSPAAARAFVSPPPVEAMTAPMPAAAATAAARAAGALASAAKECPRSLLSADGPGGAMCHSPDAVAGPLAMGDDDE